MRLAFLAAACLHCAGASAAVVYQSGSGSPDHVISLSNEFANGKHLVEDFSLSSDTNLDKFFFNALTDSSTRPVQFVNLAIYADDGAGPQRLLYSAVSGVASTTDLGASRFAGFRSTDYGVDIGRTFAAGNYFVSLNVGPDQPDLFWAIIDDATNPGNNWEATNVGGPFAHHAQENLFRFEGVAVAATAPEPASWTMMLAGFGLVGRAMRRKPEMVRA